MTQLRNALFVNAIVITVLSSGVARLIYKIHTNIDMVHSHIQGESDTEVNNRLLTKQILLLQESHANNTLVNTTTQIPP